VNRLATELVGSLNAAVLLAFGRQAGMRLFETADREEASVAARSFFAAAISLPAFVCLHLLDWIAAGPPAHAAREFTLDLAGYGLYWAGYAVLSHAIVAAIGRADLWPRYITAWNWCNVVQYLLVTAAALPILIGLPGWIAQAAGLIAMGWAFWLEWFITRTALETGPISAAALTCIDVFAGMFVFGGLEMIT